MAAKVDLLYGRGTLPLTIADSWDATVVRKRPMPLIDEWQTEMQVRTQRVGSIQLFSEGLSAEERPLTGVEVVDDLDLAVARSVERSGDPAVAVIPEGPYVVPLLQPDEARNQPGISP